MKIQEIYLHDSSTLSLRHIADSVPTSYFIMYMGVGSVLMDGDAVSKLIEKASRTHADMVYCDRYDVIPNKGRYESHPLLDVHAGSLRDDFDFGQVICFWTASFRQAVRAMEKDYLYAGFYDLWLRLGKICRIPRPLYYYDRSGAKPSPSWKSLPVASPRPCDSLKNKGERQFAYVDPKNRAVQIEMEAVCTEHLKRIGAWLPPVFRECSIKEIGSEVGGELAQSGVSKSSAEFPVTASVVIPVYNRVRTVCDAVRSALCQVCDFPFNVIVVDNYSTDGTSEALAALKEEYESRVSEGGVVSKVCDGEFGSKEKVSGKGEYIYRNINIPKLEIVVPKEEGHGIGGCWNEAVRSEVCGEFCVQLDSDDVYSGPDTLQRIVDGLREQNCAMLVGSYALTDFDLNLMPPGVIDHREWTEENGRNNALRINGLGAPRAFRTAVLREIGGFPDVSYGEDYAIGLRISREWRIGRIYDVLYCCRRWGGNSDSNLSIERQNANNAYKDGLRAEEIKARIKLNRSRKTAVKPAKPEESGPEQFEKWWEPRWDEPNE